MLGKRYPAKSLTSMYVPSEGDGLDEPEKFRYPTFVGKLSRTHFSNPVSESRNDSTSFLVPSKGYPFMMLSNATLTATSAELKKTWFSNLEKSTGICCVERMPTKFESYLNDAVFALFESTSSLAFFLRTMPSPSMARLVNAGENSRGLSNSRTRLKLT